MRHVINQLHLHTYVCCKICKYIFFIIFRIRLFYCSHSTRNQHFKLEIWIHSVEQLKFVCFGWMCKCHVECETFIESSLLPKCFFCIIAHISVHIIWRTFHKHEFQGIIYSDTEKQFKWDLWHEADKIWFSQGDHYME